MSSWKVSEILEKNKEEMKRERGKDIVFLDSINDAPFVGEKSETDADIIVIVDNQRQYSQYRRVGEVEIVSLINILVNPLQKDKFTRYEVVSENDIDVEEMELPSMLYNDPVRIWKGWLEGTTVKITRKDGGIYYRKVKG